MTDSLPCSCHDACDGVRFGRGCTSEPAPHGGYRPPYLAARQPVSRRLTERDLPTLFPGQRPALRVVRADYDGRHGDPGDEDNGRGGK
jgi:hypothetical protein